MLSDVCMKVGYCIHWVLGLPGLSYFWCHFMAQFQRNTTGVIWWPKLQILDVMLTVCVFLVFDSFSLFCFLFFWLVDDEK